MRYLCSCHILLAAQLLIALPSVTLAQTVSESWLRVAASACGGGISLEAGGELEANLLRRLKVIDGGISGEGYYNLTDVQSLLNQFDDLNRSFEAKSYRECLLNLASTAVDASGLPPREIRLDSPIAVAPLDVVRRGQRFVLSPGGTVALRDYSRIFTLNQIDRPNAPYIRVTWSNSETGKQVSTNVSQAQLIDLGEQCNIVPYNLDVEGQQASFLSNC